MKLLRGQVETVSKDGITLDVKVIDTLTQANIAQMAAGKSIVERTTLYRYVMKNCIGKINIDGKDYNPEELADQADFSDVDTMQKCMTITAMVINVAFATPGDVKK